MRKSVFRKDPTLKNPSLECSDPSTNTTTTTQTEESSMAEQDLSLQQEREFEIGKDEAWFANVKRTYDEYQQESLESIKENRSYIHKVLSDAQQNDNTRQNIANQALQNAVETANMVGKQAVRHSDIAIDRQWNVDEQGYTAEKILAAIQDPTVVAAMVAAVSKVMNQPSE